jgi:hypothetical protein
LNDAAHRSVRPYAAASAIACVLGLAIALMFRQPPALYGVFAASIGALCGLTALSAFGSSRGINGVLIGFMLGFFARAVLVAVGLIASGAHGNDALTYVFSFFGLYAATQLIEVLFVARGAQGATP